MTVAEHVKFHIVLQQAQSRLNMALIAHDDAALCRDHGRQLEADRWAQLAAHRLAKLSFFPAGNIRVEGDRRVPMARYFILCAEQLIKPGWWLQARDMLGALQIMIDDHGKFLNGTEEHDKEGGE